MKTADRHEWQCDPYQLLSPTVQCWTYSGTMATANCPLAEARDLVSCGRAYVISDQAIGICDADPHDDPADSARGDY